MTQSHELLKKVNDEATFLGKCALASIQLSTKQAAYTTRTRSAAAAVHHRLYDNNHLKNQFSNV
jgi:hypothetical protein